MKSESDLREDIRALKEDLATLRGDLRGLAGQAAGRGRERLNDAKTRVWSAARDMEHRAQEQLGDVYERAREQGEHALAAGREKISEHPLGSLLGALAAGLFIGALLGNRR